MKTTLQNNTPVRVHEKRKRKELVIHPISITIVAVTIVTDISSFTIHCTKTTLTDRCIPSTFRDSSIIASAADPEDLKKLSPLQLNCENRVSGRCDPAYDYHTLVRGNKERGV